MRVCVLEYTILFLDDLLLLPTLHVSITFVEDLYSYLARDVRPPGGGKSIAAHHNNP
jgi:hypothetical protein